jgi:hypothetical protein
MTSLSTSPIAGKSRFSVIADSFLHEPGLPLASVLDGKGVACAVATAAAMHKKQPRQLGFTQACQSLLVSWMLRPTGVCQDVPALYTTLLAHIAAREVANRPGRIEPRVLKRRRQGYPFMLRPRAQLQAELGKT